METLKCPGDKIAADLIRKVLTNQFENEFRAIAAGGATFADTFGNAQSEDDEERTDGLHAELQSFRNCLREMPVPAVEAPDGLDAIPGDDDSEYVAKLYKQVTASRKNQVQFIATNMFTGAADFWKKGGQATALFQKSKFVQVSGEAGKRNRLIILSAELLPTKEMFQSIVPHKDHVPVTKDLTNAAKWILAAQGESTICLLADGRSKKVRRVFEDLVDEHQTDEQKHLEGHILYGTPSKKDMRFQKRKTFGGMSNLEKLSGVLPVPRVRMASKGRSHFSACGENSTHATSYTNVPIRDFERLSKLSIQDKESIVGMTLPAYCERIVGATGMKGHPLCWGEVKTVDMYVALFTDLNICQVFDVAACSAAAAMAAAICNIGYEGFAINANHVNWLNRIIDKAIFAIIASRTDEESKQLRADLATYFGPTIEEARQLLISGHESDGDECDDVDSEDEQ